MDSINRQDEELAADALGALRELRAPEEARRANMAAMRAALKPRRSARVWARGVYVPMPIAALFIAVFAGLLLWQVATITPTRPQSGPAVVQPEQVAPPEPQPDTPPNEHEYASEPRPLNFEQVVYIAGIGPISRVSGNNVLTEGDR